MKVSKHLIQAIALGVTVAAFSTSISSCTKDDMNSKKDTDGDGIPDNKDPEPDEPYYCPACGMG